MSDNSTAATDLTSQYTAQVAGDLERNLKEQERVTAEIAALQEQLTVLQHDHTVLVHMQQALGLAPAPAAPAAAPEPEPEPAEAAADETAPGAATVPAPRRRGSAKPGAEKPKRTKKAAARTTPGKQARKPSAAKAARSASPSAGTDGPKLVELVRRHLSEQSEPRSAAEVTAALRTAHPERTIRTTVVRSTLEGLVARNRAQRTKQGSSVFYTAPDTGTEAPNADPS
ncbi:hypothetical protein ABZ759_22460 [Streptomyces sp. NPDC047860]|uniref:hypothetical protein n=1 Tax=Streptomyces sp. NPDC047860 TaxID=3155743 RepID=UPI003403E150